MNTDFQNVLSALWLIWQRYHDKDIKIRLRQSIRIYHKNNRAKVHPDPILNDGALGFLKQRTANKNQEQEQQDE